MKRIFIPLFLVLIFRVCTFAQTNKTLPCPTVSIMGVNGIPEPDKPIVYTSFIGEESKRYNTKYNWTVNDGEIISGQGTSKIKVKMNASSLSIVLEITGLPENCQSKASEPFVIDYAPSFNKIDEFSIPASRIDKARLDNLANEIQKNPSAQAFIIEKFPRNTSQKIISLKNQKIIDYLKAKGIERNYFYLLNGSINKNTTQFFIVPAGASPPTCDDCIIIQSK